MEWRKKLLGAKSAKALKAAETKYRHAEVKATLNKMFHGKCAYCESHIRHVDYGHIEHFRPKSKYRELTFEWTNLLLACGICNGAEFKGDSFPESEAEGRFVNPCEDEPSEHFQFTYDHCAKLANVDGITPQGESTTRKLGLNRPDLRSYRSRQVRRLVAIMELAKTNAEAAALLADAAKDDGEYSAFVKSLLSRELDQATILGSSIPLD